MKLKKYISMLLCLCMLASAFPVASFAEDGSCQHHSHDGGCGYVAAVTGSECGHVHGEECKDTELISCIHTHGEDGCTYIPGQPEQPCTHAHDALCGYVPASSGNPCACQMEEDGSLVHADGCGFVPASEGSDCTFQHYVSDGCACVAAVPESGQCAHSCSLDNGCITMVFVCAHTTHDKLCGFVEAVEGQPCTYNCELCKADDGEGNDTGYIYPPCQHHTHDDSCGGMLNACAFVCRTCVDEIQLMIDQLPEYVTNENQGSVETALSAIHQRSIYISDAAIYEIVWTKYERLSFLLSVPSDLFRFSISKISDPSGNGLLCNFTFIDNSTGMPANVVTTDGTAVSGISLVANGAGAYCYLPAGTYTIVEQVEGNWILSTTVNGVVAPNNTFTGAAGNSYVMLVDNNTLNSYKVVPSDSSGLTLTQTDAPYDNTVSPDKDYVGTLQAAVGYILESVSVIIQEENGQARQLGEDSFAVNKIDSRSAALTIYEGAMDDTTSGTLTVNVALAECAHPELDETTNECPDCDIAFEAIDTAVVTVDPSSGEYTGVEHNKPTVRVTLDGNLLNENADYALSYLRDGKVSDDFTNAGEIEVVISGCGSYIVKARGSYTIDPATPEADDFDFTAPAEKIYTGGVIEASVSPVAGITGMGAVELVYFDDNGDEATPNAAGTYTVKINVAADMNYTEVTGLTDSGWTFTLLADPADTANTQKVESITEDDVKASDKTDLENAKKDLEEALADTGNPYTDEQKEEIQAEIDRIEEALDAIENAEKVEQAIKDLPSDAKADDADVKDAKDAYEKLTDNEKSMVSDESKDKLAILTKGVVYNVTFGNHSYWYKGSPYYLGFTCDGPFAKFNGLRIDGLQVSTAYYTAHSGSTVVNLSPNLLKLLAPGPHSITFEYTDGSATGYFYVLKAPINAPITGDDSGAGMMALISGLSVMGFAWSFAKLRRRRKSN